MTTALTVRGPGAMVAAVPSLLGFHPSDSVVVIWLDRRGSVLVTQRADFAPALTEPDGLLAPGVLAARPGSAIVVLYPPDGVTVDRAAVERLTDTIETACDVRDVLAVAAGRWTSLRCEDPTCCPPDGTPVEDDPVAQEVAVMGRGAPLPSRDALAATVTPAGTALAPTGPEPVDVEAWRDAAIVAQSAALLDGTGPLDSRTLADYRVRDVILREAALRHRADPASTLLALSRAAATVRACHPSDAEGAAVVAAALAYMVGDGLTACAACDAATTANPGNTLAPLIRQCVESGLPPAAWAASLADLDADTVRKG